LAVLGVELRTSGLLGRQFFASRESLENAGKVRVMLGTSLEKLQSVVMEIGTQYRF
jgi:hypothetical protein